MTRHHLAKRALPPDMYVSNSEAPVSRICQHCALVRSVQFVNAIPSFGAQEDEKLIVFMDFRLGQRC